MHTPSYSIPLPVDTLWHTNWGFAVRQIIQGEPHNYFFDSQIPGYHRDYAGQFMPRGHRVIEHEFRPRDREGTPSILAPGVVAHIRARLTSTMDYIPLDPQDARSVIQTLWNARITSARRESQGALIEQRDALLERLQSVAEGKYATILNLPGIIGICSALTQTESSL